MFLNSHLTPPKTAGRQYSNPPKTAGRQLGDTQPPLHNYFNFIKLNKKIKVDFDYILTEVRPSSARSNLIKKGKSPAEFRRGQIYWFGTNFRPSLLILERQIVVPRL